MKALILRLDAPMMSFGTVTVDQHGFIDRFPGAATLCGLMANSLGWHHREHQRLQALQARIQYAARWDVPPQHHVDYQTVELGQPKMANPGWTTRGEREHRGGLAKFETHQRYRHYWVDGLMTVALTLVGEGEPTLEALHNALKQPARPLFLGRKACLPARPLLDPQTPLLAGEDLVSVLQQVPVWNRRGTPETSHGWCEACWPAELGFGTDRHGEIRRVFDLRDWANQLPAGSRWRAEGTLRVGAP